MDKETIKKINDAINYAIEEGIGKFGGKKPNIKVLKTPLRDGDLERSDDEAYMNSYFLNWVHVCVLEEKIDLLYYYQWE